MQIMIWNVHNKKDISSQVSKTKISFINLTFKSFWTVPDFTLVNSFPNSKILRIHTIIVLYVMQKVQRLRWPIKFMLGTQAALLVWPSEFYKSYSNNRVNAIICCELHSSLYLFLFGGTWHNFLQLPKKATQSCRVGVFHRALAMELAHFHAFRSACRLSMAATRVLVHQHYLRPTIRQLGSTFVDAWSQTTT